MSPAHQELRERLTGVSALLTTPFTEDRELDVDRLRAKTRHLVQQGITEETGALVVLGSVGECATLTPAEQRRAVDAVVDEADGRVPVVAGANHSGTRIAISLAEQALKAGADAVMSVTPYYYPPSAESVARHYRRIADAIDGGLVLYNNFVVGDIDFPVDLVDRLVDLEPVVAIKEPTPNSAKLGRVVDRVGDRATVLNGNGEPYEPQAALLGTRGFTSAMANYAPALSLEIYRLGRDGHYAALRDRCRHRVAPVADALGALDPESAPAALKYIEDRRDVPGGGPVRSPHPPLSAADRDRIDQALVAADLLEA